jgi:predicted DNA-binding transcriptional regulator AlpA
MSEPPGGATPPDEGGPLRIVGMSQVEQILNRSARTIRRLQRDDPDFPRPFRFGGRVYNWLLDDINAYVMRKAARTHQ